MKHKRTASQHTKLTPSKPASTKLTPSKLTPTKPSPTKSTPSKPASTKPTPTKPASTKPTPTKIRKENAGQNLSEPDNSAQTSPYTDQLEGRNAVLEAFKAGLEINKLFVLKGENTGSLRQILALARERGVLVKEADRIQLDSLSQTRAHQGVIAMISPVKYASVDSILASAVSKNQPPFLVILDEISDPNNLGSILRTADAVGVHGIIISKHKAIGITATVAKVSAGAASHVPVARVANLSQTIDKLKETGLWIAGTDLKGSDAFYKSDLKGPLAVVIGSEGKGISQLVSKKCDFMIHIPMCGAISSLNAGVAAGIILYEAYRQRETWKP